MIAEGYDTVRLFTTNHPANYDLLDFQLEINGKRGQEIHYNLGNLRLKVTNRGTCLGNSMAAYHFGNNAILLTPISFCECIENLSHQLGLDLWDSHIFELHFARDILTELPPYKYLGLLGEHSGQMIRDTLESNPYYKLKSTGEKLTFYDKGRELKEGQKIPADRIGNPNRLRCELRMKRGIKDNSGQKLTARKLTDPETFNFFRDKMIKRYCQIEKSNRALLDLSDVYTPSALRRNLAAFALQALGSKAIKQQLKVGINGGAMTGAQWKALSREIRILTQLTASVNSSELIEELDNKMKSLL